MDIETCLGMAGDHCPSETQGQNRMKGKLLSLQGGWTCQGFQLGSPKSFHCGYFKTHLSWELKPDVIFLLDRSENLLLFATISGRIFQVQKLIFKMFLTAPTAQTSVLFSKLWEQKRNTSALAETGTSKLSVERKRKYALLPNYSPLFEIADKLTVFSLY